MNLLKKAQTAIEQKVSNTEHNESALKQSNRWMQGITWGLIGTAGLGVAWLTLAKTEEIVQTPGTLVPIGSVQEIQMPLGGIIEDILVKDGDRVAINQLLMRLDTESSSQKEKAIKESLSLKKRQLNLLELEINRFLNLN